MLELPYHSHTINRAHQTEALSRLRSNPHVYALLMGTGTGKTKVILDEWGERVASGDIQNLLVIAPAGAYANWWLDRSPEEPSEATKHLSPELRARMILHWWSSGGGVKWRRGLEELMAPTDRPRMFVMNVEALSSVDRARAACEQFIASGRTLLCLDESTRCKNHRAIRTRQVSKLGKMAVARRIATGLVTPQSPLDLYSQFEFLDPHIIGCRTFAEFRSIYAITRRVLFPGASWPTELVVGFRNLDQLWERIAPWCYRISKEECLDLPPKVYTTRDVRLTAQQQKAYTELKQFATTKLEAEEAHVTAKSVITQILRLHQLLCGHLVDEHGNIHNVTERRTQALLDVLNQHDGKAVIWVSYDPTIRKLRKAIADEYEDPNIVAAFWGGNRSERLDEETRFKTDPRCRFMLATPGAGGVGNNWQVADLVVYHSNTYDLELRAQSEDRSHRHGQTKSVTYVDLVARGTVDEKILRVLRKKIDLNNVITGANWREWVI